jgi:tetratricopeptide (TPR) repeat protein
MARLMPEGSRLPAERRAELISRSDGIPLFLEELVRTAEAMDKGRQLYRSIRYSDFRIPAALRDPLLARLASPGVDLDLAQAAATIGRDVDHDLLRRVTGLTDDTFRARLGTLFAAGLVDSFGDNTIRFRHELIREVAYETQRRSARRERHSRIADDLLRTAVGAAQGDAGEAAFHLEKAHRYAEAIEAHLRAAQCDQDVGAHTEATRRVTRALDLLVHLPPGQARQRTELTARELRSFSAVMAGGYAAPEAAEDHPRCVELCESLGLAPELLPGLIRSWSYYAFRGSLADADQLCDTMQRVVDGADMPFPAREMGGGIIGFFRGRFGEARELMEACVAHPWSRTVGRPPAEWPLPNDPLAAVFAHLVPTLWISGERAAADALAGRALARAAELSFPYGPFSVGYVNSLLAVTRRLEGDHDGVAQLAAEMIELSERHGFVLWGLAGLIQFGISAVHGGDHSALGPLVDNVATWRLLLVADVWTPYWLTELAVAQRLAGQHDSALGSLDEALAVATETGSHFYTAETLRIRGEVRRALGHEGARTDLIEASELAGRQGAAEFGARAAASLHDATAG